MFAARGKQVWRKSPGRERCVAVGHGCGLFRPAGCKGTSQVVDDIALNAKASSVDPQAIRVVRVRSPEYNCAIRSRQHVNPWGIRAEA